MKRTRYFSLSAFLMLLFVFTACKNAPEIQDVTALPRSVPEAEGVSSAGILTFLDSLAVSRHELHSFMLLRHGKVIAEGWWDPYKPELKHTLYSTSKSFTSTAVGLAVSDSLLTVNDKVISFFPDDLPAMVSPFLADMTVKDLLMMSAGQDPDPTHSVVAADSNWVKAFLALPVVNDPGTKFLYNSLATYMLSAIVQKVTGEKIVDYLTPRLFDPLGIQGADWEVDPRGINTGGWGLRLKTEDMAKFGQLYLQKGAWNGRQIIPAAWVEEATTFKIDQAPDAPQSRKDSSDWMQGYCYQFWRCRHNAFRGDGAYGQYIIVMPDQDAVLAIQAETPDMQDEINLVWKYLLPAIKDEPLPANKEISDKLTERLSSLALPLPAKGVESPVASEISGKTFAMGPNDRQLESLYVHFMEDMCHLSLTINGVSHTLTLGAGKWIIGETDKPGPNLLMTARAHFAGLPPAKVAGCYTWIDEHTLRMVLRYIESPHTETITCRFDGKKVSVDIQYSLSFGVKQPEIAGEIKEEQQL
jgi:CubicO group peptidase (beta-lactamase class C family)